MYNFDSERIRNVFYNEVFCIHFCFLFLSTPFRVVEWLPYWEILPQNKGNWLESGGGTLFEIIIVSRVIIRKRKIQNFRNRYKWLEIVLMCEEVKFICKSFEGLEFFYFHCYCFIQPLVFSLESQNSNTI